MPAAIITALAGSPAGPRPRRACARAAWFAVLCSVAGIPCRAEAQTPAAVDRAGERVPVIVGGSAASETFRDSDVGLAVTSATTAGRRRVRRPSATAEATSPAEPGEGTMAVGAAATLSAAFTGGTLGELGSLPPDPSIAAGPSQVLIAANGRLRTFTKAGSPDGALNASTNTFFASVRGAARAVAPRVRYDRHTGRWFVLMATDAAPGRLLLAVSDAAVVTPSTAWAFYGIDNTYPGSGCAVDSPTLGIDSAALYVGVVQFCDGGNSYAGTSALVVRKSSVLGGQTPVVTAFHGLTGNAGGPGPFAPVGVDNDEPEGPAGYFVGVDNASLGTLALRRVSSPGGTPTISGNLAIAVGATASPIPVRHLGNLGGAAGYLDAGDDRLTSAVIRNGRIWTAHTIGVDAAGAASGSATRNAVRWYELGSITGSPTLVQSGTLFTPGGSASADQRSYFMPSIAATVRERTVLGVNTAGSQEFINAAVAQRSAGDAAGALGPVTALTSATAAYNPPGDPGSAFGRAWGSRSDTVVDACDGDSVWTVQSFTDLADSYGLQVARVVGPGPAVPVAVSPSTVASGVASIDLTVTGSTAGGAAFFAVAGFGCQLAAAIPGVTVNSVTYAGPGSAVVNVSTLGATPGLKAITLTNPDGQSARSAPMLTVTPGAITVIDAPGPGTAGQPLVVQGWALDGAAAAGTGVDAVHVYAYPAAGNPVFLGAATLGQPRDDVAGAYGGRFGPSGYSVTAPSLLPAGAYTIVVYAHSTASGTFNAASVAVTLTPPAPPFGALDTPADGVTVQGEVPFTGWALDDAGVAAVHLYRSPVAGEGSGLVFLGAAVFIRGARPDVQAAYPTLPDRDNAGWGFMVLTNMLPNQGNGTFDVHAYALDISGLSRHLGSRRIIAANGSATGPFGTIDTPGQGATVSGTMVNFGWALVAPPRMIPVDGSTISVYIDGVLRGHPVYNNYRSDIASLFPGYYNSNGAIGYFVFDTTQLADGLHVIEWRVRDDAGQESGLGSRFFRVRNGS